MSFCWKSILDTSLPPENSCQCFDAFLVPFTATLSRQNLELLIPEGTFTYISSSVRACTNATLMSTTSNQRSLQLATLANKYFDEKRVWRSRKQIISEPRHLAIHQPTPCHRRVFLEATHPPIQMRRNSTCFVTQVLDRLSLHLPGTFSTKCSAVSAEVDRWRVAKKFVDSRNAPRQ